MSSLKKGKEMANVTMYIQLCLIRIAYRYIWKDYLPFILSLQRLLSRY